MTLVESEKWRWRDKLFRDDYLVAPISESAGNQASFAVGTRFITRAFYLALTASNAPTQVSCCGL
jgi:hypothetical protein